MLRREHEWTWWWRHDFLKNYRGKKTYVHTNSLSVFWYMCWLGHDLPFSMLLMKRLENCPSSLRPSMLKIWITYKCKGLSHWHYWSAAWFANGWCYPWTAHISALSIRLHGQDVIGILTYYWPVMLNYCGRVPTRKAAKTIDKLCQISCMTISWKHRFYLLGGWHFMIRMNRLTTSRHWDGEIHDDETPRDSMAIMGHHYHSPL